ncbi:F0F1-ATPase subunit [Flavobacterium arcticum]|uniref:F0F1-ATPase subunit n=1 Tax=Flavobacterium arcticum TaxID=1784713 RepID=A0A345HAV1_9FLAO|nr:AtpZ/AtpI family protein [Flavobacterium arcticum]AXG73711.1 F0F1-ATPase subunit [Flavobacterium arcticum]KAF2511662.1 AtpZ/AtpI family protein [Flavobacterium arcticum]
MSNKRDNNNRNKWMALINIPLQMGIIIFLFSWFGGWLDAEYLNTKNTNRIIFTLLGVFIALYNVIRQVNELNK